LTETEAKEKGSTMKVVAASLGCIWQGVERSDRKPMDDELVD